MKAVLYVKGMDPIPAVVTIPKRFIEIPRPTQFPIKFEGSFSVKVRLSTRDKFRVRRWRRKLFKALRYMIGQPINDETKADVEKRIRLTLGRKCPE